MKLKKLDSSFYTDNPHIPQALDYDMEAGTWSDNKIRGHGIVQVHVNGLIFAIPVRSNISHSAAKILERNKDQAAKSKGMGLVRILAQREHPFWRNVNAISGFA
ncbi:TPA: hypothetical protein ON708_005119 [Citrobacter freundii]|nr:hypothetical protein [Citrobacter freundii]